MELGERQELVGAVLDALDSRSVTVSAGQLLELARVERELMHALSVVRRLTEVIIAAELPSLELPSSVD